MGLFDTDYRGLLIRIAPMDGVHQIVVLLRLCRDHSIWSITRER
jgi:hypothetical protein